MKIIINIAIALVVIAAIIFGPRLISGSFFNFSSGGSSVVKDPNASDFSAVFLSNGQVYFGEVERDSSTEIVLKNVYYLQVADTAGATGVNPLTQTHFNLIKLGQELHGPTDELFINRSQVLFYENLRTDSKIVSSIKQIK